MKKITIVGGGAAALLFAAHIDTTKYKVTLCEQKKTLGRKFLVAGEGGLNLTYETNLASLIKPYEPSEFMAPILSRFTNKDLILWLKNLGVPTFVGSSNRVFPERGIKPIEVLNKITSYIADKDIQFRLNTNWLGWDKEGCLRFDKDLKIDTDIVVFALGGASWKVTGSDGAWKEKFEEKGINVQPLRAANCAFEVAWGKEFIGAHEGKPLKNIALTFGKQEVKGELSISRFGLEGNAIYALSREIQMSFLFKREVIVHLDLKPGLTIAQLKAKYNGSRQAKVTSILSKELNLDRTSISLLKQFCDKNTFSNPDLLLQTIKAVPIKLKSAGPLDEAISTMGGIALDEVDSNFQIKKMLNSYAIGEMLDWYAPTGGYLLQGCFSMGFALADFLNGLNGEG
ncbi:TIGR03862 family flavoprotein [Cyclobacterium sediminis]